MLARLVAVLALLATASPALAEEGVFQVVVHPDNPAESVTRKQLAELFLKKVTRWPDGAPVRPVEPPETSLTRAYFLSDVIGKSAFAVKMFWQKRVYAGREVPPVEKPSDAEVLAYVRANHGAIGYVARETDVSGVKVLAVRD
jgi:ABC-type phosphate transport system substrate-binding protein